MTPSKDQSDITQLKIDVGIIKEQQSTGRDVMDRIEKKIDGMKYATVEDLEKFKQYVEANFVKTARYTPVEKVVYGLVGLILLGFGGAIMSGVIK